VKAASLNPKDSMVRKGKFAALGGRGFPKLLGYDLAGVVAAVGREVRRFNVGDAVFGMRNGFAGGTLAELVAVDEAELALKPAACSFEEAAGMPLVGLTALQALRDLAGLRVGAHVLIHGASGGVGVFAIQIAKCLGARVTTTCSARNVEFVKSLGSDLPLDYRVDSGLSHGRVYDAVFDVFGNLRFDKVRASLSSRGVYVTTVPSARSVFQEVATRWWPFRQARLVVVHSNADDLDWLREKAEAKALTTPIDRTFSLDEAALAQAHIETKRTRGKVVVRVDSSVF
jgi:NADPH:quinone reductase-like Zn-dependent oxidoreductase